MEAHYGIDAVAALRGAAHPVVLDGKTYRALALTDKDIAELNLVVRAHYIRGVRASFTSDMSDEDKQREMNSAHKIGAGLTAFGDVGLAYFSTFEGIARLAWQSIKTNHPEVSLDDFTSTLFDTSRDKKAAEKAQSNLDEFNQMFRAANHVKMPVVTDDPSKKVTAQPIRKRRRQKMSTDV